MEVILILDKFFLISIFWGFSCGWAWIVYMKSMVLLSKYFMDKISASEKKLPLEVFRYLVQLFMAIIIFILFIMVPFIVLPPNKIFGLTYFKWFFLFLFMTFLIKLPFFVRWSKENHEA
jgi:hypothetical protein